MSETTTPAEPTQTDATGNPPKTLVEGAYRQLRRDIIEGRLPPGSRLRVEHLKDDYGVGAGTLREALALLVSDTLVITEGQRGFHVAPMSLCDFEDLTHTRVMLETEALRQSITNGDDEWEGRVLAAFHRLSKAEEKLSAGEDTAIDEWEERNRVFHEVLISACASRWIHRFLGILYRQAERYRRLSLSQSTQPRNVHAEHTAIVDAVMARRTDDAVQLLSDHILRTLSTVRQLPPECFTNPRRGKG